LIAPIEPAAHLARAARSGGDRTIASYHVVDMQYPAVMPAELIDRAAVLAIADILRAASRVLFITGAGVSADSGLPTYRGIGGLYDVEVTSEGYPIEVALSGPMLRHKPEVCWKYIHQIESACRGAKYNATHAAIAEIERRIPGTWVLTQNVDGFHAAAGSRNVIEIHGDLADLHCTRCAWRKTVADYAGLEIPPTCPTCNSLVRPKVVLFGEMLPLDAVEVLKRELALGFDAVFSLGTTSVFPYIAAPVEIAKRQGVPTIEINPGRSKVSDIVDIRLPARAAVVMDAILAALG
jgi:NAD-dependent deacetylase